MAETNNQLPLYPGVELQSSSNLSVENAMGNPNEAVAPSLMQGYLLSKSTDPYKYADIANNSVAVPLIPTLRYTSDALGYDYRDLNLEYKYGDKYPALSFFNNMGKFGANLLGAFAQGIATIPFAIKSIKEGDPEVFFTNDMTNELGQWIQDLETSMPSYKTEYQDNHPFLSAFTPWNFKAFSGTWGDVVKNLGFTAGSIAYAVVQDAAVGAATGGGGAIPLIGMQLAKVGKWASTLGKGVQGFNEAGQNIKLARNAVNIASTLTTASNRLRYGTKLLTSALSEGAIEANQTYRHLRETLRQDFINKYGFEPSGQYLDEIEDFSVQGGNANLLANTALLTITNAITFDGLLKGRSLTRLATEKQVMNKTAIERIGIDKFQLKTSIDPFKSFGEKIGFYGLKYGSKLTRPLTESFEEGAQFAADKTVEDYIRKRYDHKNIAYTDKLSDSLSTGIKETFLTKEGQYNMFLGFLSGGLSNALIGTIQKRLGYTPSKEQLSAKTNAIINILNKNTVTGLFRHTYNEASTSLGVLEGLKKSVDTGDVFQYKNLQKQNFFNFILSGIKTNRFDLRIEQLEELKNLNPQQFSELSEAEFTEENKSAFNEYVDNLIDEAKSMKKSIDKVNNVFKNKYDLKSNPEEYQIYDDYKDALAYSVALTDDSLRRVERLGRDVTEALPGIDINEAVNLVNFRGIRQTVNNFQIKLSDLKTTFESLDKKSNLYYDVKKEINFLEDIIKSLNKTLTYNEAIDNLQPLMDESGRVTKRPIENSKLLYFERNIDYERDMGRVLRYLSEGRVTDAIQASDFDAVDRSRIIRSLQDIFKLDIQGRTATKYYNTLATNKGYGRFRKQVKNMINQYSTRIEIDEKGDFRYKTDAELAAEKEALIQGIAAANEALAKMQNQVLEEETATPEEKQIIQEVVNKESRGEDLTEEEEKVKSDNPNIYTNKKTAREKAEEANEKLAEELNIIDTDDLEDDTEDEKETIENVSEVKKTRVPPVSASDTKYAGANPYSLLGRIFGDHIDRNAKDGQALKNVFNIIFKTPYNDAIKSLSQNIRFVVKESTSGLSTDSYINIRHEGGGKKVYESLYRKGFSIEVEVYNGDSFLGILTLGDSLYYKDINDNYINLSQISKDEYKRATRKNNTDGSFRASNDLSTYDDFIKIAKAYEEAAKIIKEKFDKGKSEFNFSDIASLFSGINLWQGALDIKTEASEDNNTTVSNLEYLPEGAVILEIPYSEDKRGNLSRIRFMSKTGTLTEIPESLASFVAGNLNKISAIDQRFILILPTPNGEYNPNFSIIALRHSSEKEVNTTEVFNHIKKSGKTRANNNLDFIYINVKTGLGNEKGISIKIRKHTDRSVTFYVSDKNTKNEKERFGISEKALKEFNSIDDIINYINTSSTILKNYETALEVADIKAKNIDTKNTTFDYLSKILIAPVPPTVAKDFYINFIPKGEIVVKPEESLSNQEPVDSNSNLSAEQLLIKKSIDNGTLKGTNALMANIALQTLEGTKEFLKSVYEQAINLIAPDVTRPEHSMEAALRDYGKELVDLAIKTFSSTADIISDAEYNLFIDKGYVTPVTIRTIAEKIVDQKELSPREIAFFTAKTSDINDIIVKIHAERSKSNTNVSIDTYKKDLYKLGYEKKDIDNMLVSDAHEIVTKKIEKKYEGYFAIFKKIRNLAKSLKPSLSQEEKVEINQQIAELQEQLNSNEKGQLATLIERDFEKIIKQLETNNQLEKDCK